MLKKDRYETKIHGSHFTGNCSRISINFTKVKEGSLSSNKKHSMKVFCRVQALQQTNNHYKQISCNDSSQLIRHPVLMRSIITNILRVHIEYLPHSSANLPKKFSS